jgi:predicted  nucleic acid-binding Zn-ribbon protein
VEPLLAWAVCGLSAFLLGAGGFLLARVASARRESRALHSLGRARESLAAATAARDGLQAERDALRAERDALRAERQALAERLRETEAGTANEDGFGGATMLPDPSSFFDSGPHTAPNMKKLGEDEFEIAGAAEPSAAERRHDPDEFVPGQSPQDQTRKFQINSSEAVVFYLQRIDELTEENRELKGRLSAQGDESKAFRAETGEQAQRIAALETAGERLRQELSRRAQRIRQLEGQRAELAYGGGHAIEPRTVEIQAVGPSAEAEILDQATLQVQRVDLSQLEQSLDGNKPR